MFALADGCKVHDLDGVSEGYDVLINDDKEYFITLNVSAENIESVFLGLAGLVAVPTVGVIQVPSHRDVHERLNSNGPTCKWADVFFRYNTSISDFERIVGYNRDIFVHDGMIIYGLKSREYFDIVRVGKYKIFHVYTTEPKKYVKWLREHGYERRSPLKTVRENFSDEHPGECHSLRLNGETCYELAERLKAEGFFFWKNIEDE